MDAKEVEVRHAAPDIDSFLRLRAESGLSPRSAAAAAQGLPNSLYAVILYHNGVAVGMGRVVGDGGCNFEVTDVAVSPAYQGSGLGRLIMTEIDRYLREAVPAGSYTCLIADTPWLYEKFGFERVTPKLEGMQRKTPLD